MVSGIGGAGGPDLSYMVSKMFKTLDTNGDESISSDELSVLAEQGAGIDVNQIMSDLDADGSGGIDASETESALKKLGETLRNRLGGTEMPMMDPPDPEEMFSRADTDGDGVISREEFAAIGPEGQDETMVEEMFASIDSDGDGSISEAEHTAAMEEMGPPPGGGMPAPPPPDGMATSSDSEEESGVLEIAAAANGADTDSIRQLLDALKSSETDEDEEDATGRIISRLSEELENAVSYGNQGSMRLNMDGIRSLFSVTA